MALSETMVDYVEGHGVTGGVYPLCGLTAVCVAADLVEEES